MTEERERATNVRRNLYRPAPWLVVRTPLLPVSRLSLARAPRRALENPDVVQALAIGCPDLLATLRRPSTKGRDRVRAETSLARYLIRMTTRPTPYGAFAGVSLASWGPETTLALAPGHKLRTRPDMGWALGLLRTAEADPEVRAHATWRADPLAFEHDGRLLPGTGGVSVKATRPARLALTAAARPLPYAGLRAQLLEQTGGTSFQVETLLTELWQHGLLLTDLKPRITGAAATEGTEVAERLRAVRPETAVAVDRVLDLMRDFDRAPAGEAETRLAALEMAARAIAPSEQPVFQTDMARPLAGDSLSEAVAAECARAAELLLRLTPSATASPDLSAYQHRFEARYGPDREVPLLELFDPVVGLGPMPHTHGGDAAVDSQQAARRADALMALALGGFRAGRRTVELDRATIESLQTWSPTAAGAPLSLDLAVFIVAASPAALDRGEFSVVVGPNLGAPSGGRWLGRFADLLAPQSEAAYAWLLEAESAARPGPVPAEVIYLPAHARTTNVVIRPITAAYEIVVDGRPGAADVIELADLVVGCRSGQLYLRSLRLGREVRPTARHMLNHHGAPPVCQFLEELAHGNGPRLTGFNWGQAESLPCLPRVCSGRIVLEPARWRLPVQASAAGQVIDLAGFRSHLAAWRERWDVPSRVYVSTSDNRLLLDLDEDGDIEQLHREARQRRGGDLRLQEALPDVSDAWLPGPGGSYLSEVVVPLVLRQARGEPAVGSADVSTTAAEPRVPLVRARPRVDARDRIRLPGSDWLFAKFYLPADRITELLTGPVADLCSMADNSGLARRWFFLRYSDPEPHLRVRWQGEPELLLHQLLPQVTSFAEQLVDAGRLQKLVIDSYEREVERYGGLAGTEISERIFDADSRTVLGLLGLPTVSIASDGIEVAAVTVHTLLADLGLDAEARLALYRGAAATSDESVGRRAGEDFRQRKTLLRRLLGPEGATGLDPSGRLGALLELQRAELATAGSDLVRLAAEGRLPDPLDSMWPSYVHMHLNRLIGGAPVPNEAHLMHLLRRTQEGLLLSAHKELNPAPAAAG
jgi:thiopeptide-type bacteriocin biosynthesis protein